jgi:hypothetical protein
MKKLIITAILFFIIIAFLFQFYENTRLESFANADTPSYLEAAKLLYQQNFKVHPYRPPLFPLVLGIPYLFGIEPKAFDFFSVFMNFSFWLLTIVLIYKIVLKMSDSKVESMASIVFFINLGNIAMINKCTLKRCMLFYNA